MQMWEYHRVVDPKLVALNDLGREGWEMVGVATWPDRFDEGDWRTEYVFKRPLAG